jgi:hypothetical protein
VATERIPGIPGNLFPGGPIFAGPGAPATNVTVNVTGNNIDNQVDLDAMAQQVAAAVADGQRSAANARAQHAGSGGLMRYTTPQARAIPKATMASTMMMPMAFRSLRSWSARGQWRSVYDRGSFGSIAVNTTAPRRLPYAASTANRLRFG